MLDPLSMCADLLKKVISMPQLFKDSKDYNKSAKKALSFVKCIKRIVHLRVEYEARVNDIAQEMFKQHKHLPPHDVEPENDKTQWPSWSSNVVGVGSEEQRAAIVRKSTFKAIASYLPRAGCAIVEDWREDLNGTVSSIAQVRALA